MFNRISSKLRGRSSSGSGNGQKDKGFAYGKMQKPGDPSWELSSTDYNGNDGWADNEDHHEKHPQEDFQDDVSLAESIFPDNARNVKDTQPLGRQSTDSGAGNYVSGHRWSFDDERASKNSWEPHSSVQEEDINIGPPVLRDYDDAEEDFLGDFEEYFQNLSVDNVRKEQYPKLDIQRLVYLDYARCGLYSSYQVQDHMRILLEEGPFLGFPHTGFNINNYVVDAQDRLLELFNTDRAAYSLIFTTGLTAGFRLMGEAFTFQRNTPLLVCQDNHEAVRELTVTAAARGARPILAPIGESDLSLHRTELRRHLVRQGGGSTGKGGLFVFPVQSCASGVVHSLNWVAEAQQNGWQVLIDASTYIPTGMLDLSLYQPEFVLGSITHLLGYPSGIGFLLVRRSVSIQQATGYSSAKVKFISTIGASSGEGTVERDCLILDEDNILNALSFSAVASGLAHLKTVGHEAIRKRVRSLATWLVRTLVSLKHKGDPGPPLARVYGPLSTKSRGSVVAFSLLDSTGSELPPSLVQKLAEKNNILIGAGQLSSPGVTNLYGKASERARDISVFDQKTSQFELIRVSLGPMSNFQDVYRFAQFLSRFRDEDYLSGEAIGYYGDDS